MIQLQEVNIFSRDYQGILHLSKKYHQNIEYLKLYLVEILHPFLDNETCEDGYRLNEYKDDLVSKR